MATTFCPPMIADPAVIAVNQAHDKFMTQGNRTFDLALQALNDLNNVDLEPRDITISFDYDAPQPVFHRPERPQFDDAQLEFRDPGDQIGAAPSFAPGSVLVDAPPEFNEAAPTLTYGARPHAPDIAVPVAPSPPSPLSMPVAPDYTLPPVPTLEQLSLPAVPDIQLPTFDSHRPEFVEPPFNEDWTFQPEAYTRVLANDLINTLRPMIVGSAALPAAIERAIFQRGADRIELETNRAIDQAFADTANRGFVEPTGATLGQISELRQAGLNAISEVSRDTLIKQFEESLASQRFAITQGAAFEGVLINLHIEEQRFLLQAATFQRESAVAVLNYRATVFNLRLQAYQTDAAVLRDRIQAELARVEVFRAQLDGQRLRGELNLQRVQIYEAQLRGVTAMADFYRTQVEAVKVQADTQRLEIDRFKAQVDAYGERWRAHVAEWQGYTSSIEGEGKRVEVFGKLVDANARRVDAWAKRSDLAMEAERLRMAQHGVNIDVWRAGLDRYRTRLSGEQARLAAVGQAVDARARIYTADAQVESAASAASDRSFELGLQRARAHLEAQLERARMDTRQAEFLLTQWVEIQRAKAQIASQLAASTMSAVHYGASLSSGRSQNQSCSQNYTFTGEIADAGV